MCLKGDVLWKKMHTYLMSIVNVNYIRHIMTDVKKKVIYWQFLDNIPLDVDFYGKNKRYDSKMLLKSLAKQMMF